MFMQDDRILQNLCWLSEAFWALQHLEIEIMIDIYQIVLANISPNYNVFWVILKQSKSRKID